MARSSTKFDGKMQIREALEKTTKISNMHYKTREYKKNFARSKKLIGKTIIHLKSLPDSSLSFLNLWLETICQTLYH